ncbi:MAG: hypothetical protein KGR98_07580, partial [Verrucomicrobia bacterium]|nr:hypothetical protein [Verrucomicrobiota bacterium]
MSADSKRGTVLMVADSERDANMLHATGLFAPDAFIYLKTKGEATIFASDLEIDRARRQSHCRVEALSAMQEKLRARGARHPGFAEVIVEALRQRRARRVMAPENFPLGLARQLEAAGVRVTPRGDLFSEREFKTAEQARKISASLRMAEAGMAEAMRILRASKIGKGGKLM